jgi:CheY-like chemotaxis protein
MQPLELATAVISAIEMTSPLLERRHQRLDMDVAPEGLVVDADPNRLAQIIANLLANASKYSDDGSRIAITAVKQTGCVQLKVADEGIGIANEMLGRIFDLFVQQRQALDRAAGGLGLGLPIARSLARLHGGSLTAASAGLGKGSDFVLELPLSPPALDTQSDVPRIASLALSSEAAASKRRILVVDDNEDAAGSLARMLQALGHTVRVAHDGPSALTLARRFCPEIALLDIGLPGMDGYELARRLRAEHDIGIKMKLIAITGYGQQTDRLLAKHAGFDLHLVKPASLRLLMAAITS